MMLKRLLQNQKSLLGFVFLTYVDKALYFLLPMLVIYISDDELAYNSVEYVCSIGNIIVPFLTFISSYAFYGYKESEDKEEFVREYNCFSALSTLIIGGCTLCIAHLTRIFGIKGVETFELFIAIRTMFYIFVLYINSFYRLIDKPSRALMHSIVINCASALSLLTMLLFNRENVVEAFFYPELLAGIVALWFIIKSSNSLKLSVYLRFLSSSILFAWPIVLNSTAVAFVANYGKVYAYNFFSSYEMYCFSFVMRMAMILQMAHSSVISFFSKDIYLNGFSKKFFVSYASIMGCSLVGVFAVLLGYNRFFARQVVPVDIMACLVFIYTILHMIGAVIEVNFGRFNQNKYIFIMSAFSCAIYMFFIFIVGVHNTTQLALYMVIYMIVYVSLLFITSKRVLN